MSKISRKLKRKKRAAERPDPLLQKAFSYYHVRNWEAADNACREILRRSPENHKAMNLLSIVLTNKPDLDQAEKYIRKAIKIKPNEPAYLSNLGLVLKEQEKWEESFTVFTRANGLRPQDDETLYNLGTVYQALRKIEQAKEHYRKAISLNPRHVQALCALCNLLSRQEEGREELKDVIGRMEMLLSHPDIQRMEEVYFELARVYDKLGKYHRVFEYLNRANRIVRESFHYDIMREKEVIGSVKHVFTSEFLNEKKGFGSEDPSPIFILGMPRSGTTLVEQILASHSGVAAGGELYFLNTAIMGSPYLASPFRVNTIKLPDYSQIRQVPDSDFRKMADAYLTAAVAVKHGKIHFTDKMPHNFINVGMIKLLFPNSKVVHCRRNPMDNCLSLYMQHFKVLHPYMYSLEEIGAYYVSYKELMDHWQKVLPEFMLEVQYEEMVYNPEEETRRLLEFCGLEWEEACLAFYKLRRYVKTASEGQVDQPLYTSSIGRWKKYEMQLLPLQKILKEGGLVTE